MNILLPITGFDSKRKRIVKAYCLILDDKFSQEQILNRKWCFDRHGYPHCNKSHVRVYLHQFIYEYYHGSIAPGMEVDHKDRDILNCLPTNLRTVTHSINNANKPKQSNNKSGFKGVSPVKDKSNQKYCYWKAQVVKDGQHVLNKVYPFTEEGKLLAAKAVNESYKEHYPGILVPNPDV